MPGGAIGVQLKSTLLFNCAQGDSMGVILDPLKRLSVITACGTSRS